MAHIQDKALRTIVITILILSGLAEPHLDTQVIMYYGLYSMSLTVFDWCTIVLNIYRGQLIGCRTRRLKNIGFGRFICSFFFERIPSLSP